jgi:hypothetical protein
MSTIKADAVTTKSDNTDLTITGGGTGVPNLEAGFKVAGTVGVPIASIQDDAVTLAKMAAGVDGVIITYDASGNPVHVGPGSDGEVLTSTGAGSPPAFEAAGGAWAFIEEQTVSSGTALNFTTSISSYPTIVFLGSEIVMTDSDSQVMIRVSVDGGSTFITTSTYVYANYSMRVGSATLRTDVSSSANMLKLVEEQNTQAPMTFQTIMQGHTSTTGVTSFRTGFSQEGSSAGTYDGGTGNGWQTGTALVDAIRFVTNGASYSGTIRAYGIVNS